MEQLNRSVDCFKANIAPPMEALTEIENIQAGKFKTNYVIVGEELYFQEKLVQAIREKITEQGVPGLNEDIFHAKESDISEVISSAKTLPMMAPQKFIWVKNADVLKKEQLEMLTKYFEKPNPSSCLVVSAKTLDGRSRFIKLVKKQSLFIETKPLRQSQIKSFVRLEANARGHKIHSEALELIEQLVENDLSSIVDAIERLSLFVGDKNPITPKDIESCISASRVETIWKLVDSMGNQNLKEALSATSSMLSNREPALRILFMIARQFRMLAKAKDALSKGSSAQDAAKAAGAPPFKARELAAQAKKLTNQHLEKQAQVIFKADQKLKSSKLPPELILENAVIQLCTPTLP